MRPRRLELEGFGTFRDRTEIDFTDVELVALVGATGSGKSTIIDAITFALYGAVARYADNRVVEPVINQTSTRARVRLEFELSGQAFTAVRLVQRTAKGATTKEARLERGDEVLAADARSMTTLVTELLGLDVDQFNRTVVLPQGRFADFLHDSPSERQATLRQLLGFEMYQRIGKAARARAATARAHVDALQPELDAGVEQLTDERRAAVVASIERLTAARTRFADARQAIAELDDAIAVLDGARATHTAGIDLLIGLAAPDDVDQTDARVDAATAAHGDASAQLDQQRVARRAADDAVAAGPELSTVTLQRKLHADAGALAADHGRLVAERAAADTARVGADEQAAAIERVQAELDTAVEAARDVEASARAAVDALPTVAQLDAWVQLHDRHDEAVAALAAIDDALRGAGDELAPLESAVEAARRAEQHALERRDELRERVGAAALAHLLVPGEPCPLCLHEVAEMPVHHVDAELSAAVDDALAAAKEHTAAVEQRDAASARVVRLDADARAARASLERLAGDLAGVAPVDALVATREQAAAAAAGLDAASTKVRDSADAAHSHRHDPRHVELLTAAQAARDAALRLAAAEEATGQRLGAARELLVGVPPDDELERRQAEAQQLLDAQRSAAVACERGEQAVADAERELDAARRARAHAATALHAARDRVAALGPPPVAGERLGADWQALVEWAGERRTELEAARAVADEQLAGRGAERAAHESEVRTACASALGDGSGGARPLVELGDLLTERLAGATAELGAFDAARGRLVELRERVDGLTDAAAVADQLGLLLRADRFEGWLMEAALEQLVEAATIRLRELSGGLYSLELDDRNFVVRDHGNADEVRNARSLSGGETFLASLSLALALAESTAELAPEGSPTIDSIFLDEGFGTLDPATLDTVAAAIEELGAAGRMVGIVTHIRELADRMPVRLEVTKHGGTSTVERVEI